MSVYYRHFFKCKSCGFMFTNVQQEDVEISGDCPVCEEGTVDYAPKNARMDFVRALLTELPYVVMDAQDEEVDNV